MQRHKIVAGVVAAILAGWALIASPTSAQAQPDTFVWPHAPAAEQGIDPTMPNRLREELTKRLPRVQSFGIARHGRIVFEYFREGTTAATPVNVASVTKSVLALLVAIALDKGIFASVDQPISDFFPELEGADVDPRVRTITLRHLLTMTAGWESRDSDIPPFQPTDALKRRLAYAPGEHFQYDNATSHLIAIALGRAAQVPVESFAEENLFGPLGIKDYLWGRDVQGRVFGWHMLHVNLRDMLKFGQLVLNRGAWGGRQVVSAGAITDMLVRRNGGGAPSNTPYGYQWYVMRTPDGKHEAFGAFGYGGQLVYVVPALDLVIVKTQPRDQRDGDARFVREIVMPAIWP